MRNVTLCFPIREKEVLEVLLGLKRVRFGAGRRNGFGGRVEPGETIPAATVRELREEVGFRVEEAALELRGSIRFYFADKPEWNQEVHISLVRRWKNVPTESDEMEDLRWYPFNALPFEEMWAADRRWLPVVLGGKSVSGEVRFSIVSGNPEPIDYRVVAS